MTSLAVRRWRRRRGERSGRRLQGLSQDQVLQRLVEQIFGDFSGHDRAQPRFVEQNHVAWDGGAVLRRDGLSRCFTWNLDIICTSPLLRHFTHMSCDSLRRHWKNFLSIST